MDFVTAFGVVSGVVTLAAICLAIYQTRQAKRSDEKLEETRNCLAQLEKNLATSDLKLIKAVEYYNNGHFDDSLKAFRGYIKDSDDISEINSAINEIFWKESKKIYGKYLGNGTTTAMLVVTMISKRHDIEGSYPEFLIQLLELASTKEGNSLAYYKVPVFLNLKNYESALKHLDGLTGKASSKKSNQSFREYVKYFCEFEIKQEYESA
jgi:hypothetical protein